jgi:hypothetical protein
LTARSTVLQTCNDVKSAASSIQELQIMARSSFPMLAVLAALLLVAARPAHGDCSNDDEGADDDTSCPQVGCTHIQSLHLLASATLLGGWTAPCCGSLHVAIAVAPVHADSLSH